MANLTYFGGGTLASSASWTYAAENYQYIGYPTGNLTLSGARHTPVIESVGVNGLTGGYAELRTSGNVHIIRTGSPMKFARYSLAGSRIEELNDPWLNSSLQGYYYWSTVPTAPQAISDPIFNQGTLTVTNIFAGALSDGGSGLTSYSAQYINTSEGKTITNVSRSGTTATVTVASHGYSVGNVIQVYGLVSTASGLTQFDAELNGQRTITAVTTSTITFSASLTDSLQSRTVASHAVNNGLVGVYGGWTGTKSVGSPFSFSAIPGRHYQMRVYANNARGSSQATTSKTVFALPNPPVWGAKTLNPNLTQSKPYDDSLNITGYSLSTPVTLETGALPSGITFYTSYGSNDGIVRVYGTPSASAPVGTYSFRFRATNVGGSTLSPVYTINLSSSSTIWNSPGKGSLINTDNTPYALRNGVQYNPSGVSGIVSSGDYLYAVGASSGTYSIISGSLPSGITAENSVGTINGQNVNIFKFSGTPTVSGTFNFVVRVSLDGGATYVNQAVSLYVRPTGKRYTTGSSTSETPLTIIKRYDPSAGWVDVTIGKRYDGTNWVELGNPS
jgi:hypothetical protein